MFLLIQQKFYGAFPFFPPQKRRIFRRLQLLHGYCMWVGSKLKHSVTHHKLCVEHLTLNTLIWVRLFLQIKTCAKCECRVLNPSYQQLWDFFTFWHHLLNGIWYLPFKDFLENALKKTKFPFLPTELALCMHVSGELCLLFFQATYTNAYFVF